MYRAVLRLLRPQAKSLLLRARLASAMSYSVEERGAPYSLDYRIFFKKGSSYISPFHDIPLYCNAESTLLNMVVEVPRWTNAKMEIAVAETLNPIKQDVKKEKLRFVNNCFPYHGYMWNYGALPQTWEDPGHVDADTGCRGDNDPLDVCEIGYRVARRGEVLQVKVLGTLALIDEGETDWKVLVIDVKDPLAEKLNDVGDIEQHMPGFLAATVEWFKIYKMPTGKPPNQFAFEGQAKNQAFAMNIVQQTNEQWKVLIGHKNTSGISCETTTQGGSPYFTSAASASAVVGQAPPPAPPQAIDPIVDKWFYVSA